MASLNRGELIRIIGLSVVVLLEGATALSIALRTAFLPLGAAYPYVISAAAWVLPALVGLLSRRIEAAAMLAVLPIFVLALVYITRFAPVWNVDLFTLGVQAGRTAGVLFLSGGLGLFGWLLRRVVFGEKSTSTQLP
jgi:hypothetical protein